MDSNSDDSSAAGTLPDETVWPPPPTGPRVVAVGPSPQVRNGFRVPKWAKASSYCLLIAFAASWIDRESPIFVNLMLGGLLFLDGLLILIFLAGTGTVAYARMASAVSRQVYSPTKGDGKYFTPNAWLGIFPHLMFVIWGLSFLFSSQRDLLTRIAVVFWLALIVAGLGVAIVDRVKYWLQSGRIKAT